MIGIDIISSALRMVGIIAPGETPDADIVQDALLVFNGMLDSWATERLMVFNVARTLFPLNPGQALYQMGAGAPDFNAPRPPRIVRAGIINLNNPAQPLELQIEYTNNEQKWAETPVKLVQSSLPQLVYDDNAFPFRNLSFYPVPNVPVQVALYVWNALTQLTNLDLDLEFPPGYYEAIKYNLAVRLAPEMGDADVSPSVMALAISSKAVVKAMNIPVLEQRCDTALTSADKRIFNWLTGQ